MNTYTTIDKSVWPRTEMFEFFQGFDNPCVNITVPVEAEALYTHAKAQGHSFFLLALYAILRAANSVPQLRQRIVGDAVVEFAHIAAMTPIMTPQELFNQVWCEYAPTFDEFAMATRPLMEAAKTARPAPLLDHGDDFICASCSPWLHFTATSQAEMFFGQSIPILAWGKFKNGVIPVNCKFHHGLVDGLHIGRFFGMLEESFAHPQSLHEVG